MYFSKTRKSRDFNFIRSASSRATHQHHILKAINRDVIWCLPASESSLVVLNIEGRYICCAYSPSYKWCFLTLVLWRSIRSLHHIAITFTATSEILLYISCWLTRNVRHHQRSNRFLPCVDLRVVRPSRPYHIDQHLLHQPRGRLFYPS